MLTAKIQEGRIQPEQPIPDMWEGLTVQVLPLLPDHADDFRDDDWPSKNARRVALIRQRFAQGLNASETQELEHLQELAAQRLEAWDSQLLSDVAAMREAVERVVSQTGTATTAT